ncbi:cerebellin-1-like [Mercenaria mercenaria]|uniref:cerebellin-1-like n=1 Tax=Mercenaria mercenaria TaxID=6596 RepID=UPI00234E4161|nr:cerebellin-1-like [Mercenaria mercenaria]
MNVAEFKAMRGTVGMRLEQKGEFKRLEEEISSFTTKITNLERKTTLIMKYTGVGAHPEEIDGDCVVSFSANLSTNAMFKADETLKFDEVLTNEGDGFNSCTGEFIAPVPGKYLISLTARAQFHKQISAEIVCNGKMLGRITSGYGGIDKAASSMTVAEELRKDDKVFVKQTTEKSGEYHGNGYTTFSGFRFD